MMNNESVRKLKSRNEFRELALAVSLLTLLLLTLVGAQQDSGDAKHPLFSPPDQAVA